MMLSTVILAGQTFLIPFGEEIQPRPTSFTNAKLDYSLSVEARGKVSQIIGEAYAKRGKEFGNGRFVRNVFEKTLERNSSKSNCRGSTFDEEHLTTITEDDIQREKYEIS